MQGFNRLGFGSVVIQGVGWAVVSELSGRRNRGIATVLAFLGKGPAKQQKSKAGSYKLDSADDLLECTM